MDHAFFLAKKILGGLLMPVPTILLLLIWAFLFLLRRKTRWLGFLCLLAGAGWLFVASYQPLAHRLIAPLEAQVASYQLGEEAVDYVAVLGASHQSVPGQPVTSQVSPAGVVRLVEGIRVYRLNPGSRLVFTGYHGLSADPVSYPEKLKELAISLGVPAEDILTFSGPRDTAEEARLLAETLPVAELVLVTSASHMPRALALFKGAGLQPVPAPTHHLARSGRADGQFPSAHDLARTRDCLHERLGLWWAQLTGQLKESSWSGD